MAKFFKLKTVFTAAAIALLPMAEPVKAENENVGQRGEKQETSPSPAFERALRALDADPLSVMYEADKYIRPLPRAQGAMLLTQAMARAPADALWLSKKYLAYIPAEERAGPLINAVKHAPYAALSYVSQYIEHIPPDQREELLVGAIKQRPLAAFIYANEYMPYIPAARRLKFLIPAMEQEPARALVQAGAYIHHIPEEKRTSLLEWVARNVVANMLGVNPGNTAQLYLEPETVEKLGLVLKLRHQSLITGRKLNDLHNEPDHKRFAEIKDYSAADLYNLLVFGRDELYTSSYLGVFDRFAARLGQERYDDIFDVADPAYKISPLIFLQMAAAYDTLGRAVSFIPDEKWEDILVLFAEKIEQADSAVAVSLAEIMTNMPAANVKEKMEHFLQVKYDNAPTARVRDIYAVTAAYYNAMSGREAITIQNPAHYQISPLDQLTVAQIQGSDGIHRQLMVFSDDVDGYASYENFQKRYRNNSLYKIEDHQKYIKISSAHGSTHIEIYANHPDSSPDAIITALAGQEETDITEVEFDAVIHRGHSYNLDNTMPYFSQANSFVFLGSCGGFNNIARLMKIAPDVQIVSTKRTGTKYVNDPLLYHINEAIRQGGPVIWENEQAYLDDLRSPHKKSYILPHKNAALLMNRKLNALARERRAEQSQDVSASAKPAAGPLPSISRFS